MSDRKPLSTAAYTQELAPLGYSVWVSLDQSIPFGDLTATTTKVPTVSYVVTNPNYSQRQSDSGDIGVLILADSLKGVTPATLPTCGLLDELDAQNGLKAARFTAVGYVVQNRVVGGGVPYFQIGIRYRECMPSRASTRSTAVTFAYRGILRLATAEHALETPVGRTFSP